MTPRLSFVASLPKSGADILLALLSQNPEFYCTNASPLLSLTAKVIQNIREVTTREESSQSLRDARICRSLWDGVYEPFESKVCFDGCGSDGLRLYDVIKAVEPLASVILCVRDIRSIIQSLESDRISDPFTTVASEFSTGEPHRFATIEQRTAAYLQTGELFAPLHAAYNIIQSGRMRDLFIIRYEDFVKAPQATLSLLYAKLGLKEYAHTFSSLPAIPSGPFSDRMSPPPAKLESDAKTSKLSRMLSNKIVEGSRWFYEYFYPEELTLRPQNLGHAP